MEGLIYLLNQSGLALAQSEAQLTKQAERIQELEAELAEAKDAPKESVRVVK